MSETAGPISPEARSAATGVAKGELVFRIHGGDYHGRIVRIRAPKCTVGAAADCTLRLAAPGVRPLHCIILQGEAGASVRRWSPDTQLNGRAFSDALLMVGDRLQIGPIELEVIDDVELAGRARPASSPVEATNPSAPVPVADLAGEIVQHIRKDLEKDKDVQKRKVQRKRLQQARERMKRLEMEVQKSTQAAKRLELEVSRLHSESKIAQHERLYAESQLAQAQSQLQRLIAEGSAGNEAAEQWRRKAEEARAAADKQASQWEAERTSLRQSLDAIQSELTRREAELTAAKADFNERLADWNGERTRLTQAVQSASISVPDATGGQDAASLLATLERERAEWERERKGFQKSLDDKLHREHRLEIALSELRKSIDQEHLAASDERQQLEEQRRQLEARAEELDRYQAWCDEVAQKVRGQDGANPNVTLAFSDGNALADDTRQQLEDAQRQLDEAQQESERLRNELSDASRQLAAVRESHLSLLDQRGELEMQLGSHTQQLQARSAELSEQQQRLAGAQRQAQEAAQSLSECRSERDALRDRLTQCEQQLQSASADADARQQLAARSQELAAAQAELERVLVAKSQELAALQSEMKQQLAAISAEQAGLQTDLEQQLEAKSKELAGAQAELEQQLVVWSQELSEAQAENQRLKEELRQKDENQVLCEQNFQKKIECLEKLARNLEDELHAANANSDVVDRLEAEKQSVEQQLAAAQEQWNSQREMLEEQALTAHQQLQVLEDQITSLRDALSSMRAQVVERDNLLSQLREEVRQQWSVWQAERDQLRRQLEGKVDEPSIQLAAAPTHEPWAETAPPVCPNMELTGLPMESIEATPAPSDDANLTGEPQEDRYVEPEDPVASITIEDDAPAEESQSAQPQAAPEAPVKVSDVLARLGAAGVWNDATDLPAEAPALSGGLPAAPIEEPPPAQQHTRFFGSPSEDVASEGQPPCPLFTPPAASSSDAAPPDGPEHEESIEAYMARLLKRVRGDAVATTVTVPAQSEPEDKPAAEDESIAPEPVAADEPSEEYAPRTSAPELQTDMAAMRELAVHSARQAINQSTQRKYRQAALLQTLGAFIACSASIGLFAWGWDTGNRLAWGGCAVSLVAGLCLTIRRLKMLVPQRALAGAK